MNWFGKENAKESVPETIGDAAWERIQRGTAKKLPAIDGPWVDPKTRATVRALNAARKNAESN